MAAEFIFDPGNNNHYLRLTEKTNIVTFNALTDSVKNYNFSFGVSKINNTITGTNSNITFSIAQLRLSQTPLEVNTISSNFLYLDDGGINDTDFNDLIIRAIFTGPGNNNANASNSPRFYFSGLGPDKDTDVRNYKFKLSSLDINGSLISPPPAPSLQSYVFTVSKNAALRNIIRFRAYVPDVGMHEFYIDSDEITFEDTNITLTKSVYSNVEYSLSHESLRLISAKDSEHQIYNSTQTTGNLLILGGSQIDGTNLYAYPGQQYVPVIGRGIKTKNDNIWKTPLKEYVKYNGEWKEVQASWVKQNNEWKKVFPVGNNWINFIDPIVNQNVQDDYLDFAIQVVAIN